jgi:iron complex outermembrane receptor protein
MTRNPRALRAAILASAATFAATPALAQQAPDDGLTLSVSMEAGPSSLSSRPLTTQTLGRDRLDQRQSGSSDTAALLAELPGVSARTGGGFSSMPAIRGLTEQRLGISVDGQPIDFACPNDMNTPLSYTDPQTIQSVNVITGVSPVSLGGDSIGGLIQVESAPPRFAVGGATLITGRASAFYRSNGSGLGGALNLTVASAHLSATYTGSYTQSENYRAGGDLGEVRSTEYAKTDHALALAWHNAAGLFQLKGGYHFSPREGFPNQYMDMTSNRSWFLNGRYQGAFDWGTVEFAGGYRDTDHEMNFLDDKGGTADGGMPMNTEVRSANAALKFAINASARDTLRVGAELHHQWLNDWWPPVPGSMMMGPDTFINVNGGTRDRLGLYGEWERRWTERFSTVGGLRLDRVRMNTGEVQPYGTDMMQMADAMAAAAFNAADRKRTDSNWSGSILAGFEAADGVKLELGYAHKVRSPNLYERYAWGRGNMSSSMIGWYGDGNGYVGNLDLKPERADTLSAAAVFGGEAGGWTLRVAPYYTRVHDYIDATFLQDMTDMMGMPTGFVQLQFDNQDAEFLGVDLSGAVQLRKGDGADGTRLKGSFSWARGQNPSDSAPLYHQMPASLTAGLEHRQGALELGADFGWVTEKTRVDATRNEPRTDAYALLDLRVAYTLKGVRLSLEATNLFDKGYSLPLGGMSLGDRAATGVLRPVPGAGRSVNLGLSTSF